MDLPLIIVSGVLFLSVVVNVGLLFVVARGSQRLLEFDDLFQLFVHDLETNLKFFDRLSNTPVMSNSPEILDAQLNMRIIRDRLVEYIVRMEEQTRRRLRKPAPKSPNPPVVV